MTDDNGNTYASVSSAVNAASEGEELVLTLSGDLTENIYVNKRIDLTMTTSVPNWLRYE